MLNFKYLEIINSYGDFGSTYFCDEFEDADARRDKIIDIIKSSEFEKIFNELLSKLVEEKQIDNLKIGKLTITKIANESYAYAAAGHIALAKCLGKSKLILSVFPYLKDYTLKVAKLCKDIGITFIPSLTRSLASDNEYVNKLKSFDADVDDKLCFELQNTVDYNANTLVFMDKVNSYHMYLTANGFQEDSTGITKLFIDLYGEFIKQRVTDKYECVIAPIFDGTNALSVFNSFVDEEIKLITVEESVAQEYHDGFTLVTRLSKPQEINTILCPELCNLWREGKVIRLGADRYAKVDITPYDKLNDVYARALALCLERYSFNKILLVEV